MNYTQLAEYERYQISVLLKEGFSNQEIGHRLGRHPATIGREIRRNKGLRGYRPKQAQELTEQRRCQAHKARKVTPEVVAWVESLLRQQLSPEQVVDYLRRFRGISLHHETVYQLVMPTRLGEATFISTCGLCPRLIGSGMEVTTVEAKSATESA